MLEGNIDFVRNITDNKIQLKWLKEAYSMFPDKNNFFLPSKSGKAEDYFFNKLAGNSRLMQQIKEGANELVIRSSWKEAIDDFIAIRKKYLIYKDFEY
jgi:uncharacterized protein YbbC (DUF1343 family)